MMARDREKANDYVSIRQIWIQGISDCRRAIAQRAIPDASWEKSEAGIGDRAVTDAVRALYYSLVDYGEAIIKTDADRYHNETFNLKDKKIWESDNNFQTKYRQEGDLAIKFYHFIIQTLNKYGMLFESQPEGYSNVEMISV